MVTVISILGFASVFFGYAFKNFYLPGSNFFINSIFYSSKDLSSYSEFIFFDYDFFFFVVILFTFIVLFFNTEKNLVFRNFFFTTGNRDLQSSNFKNDSNFKSSHSDFFLNSNFVSFREVFYLEALISRLLNSKLYFDIIYNFIAKKVYIFFYLIFEILEKGFFDLFGPSGFSVCIYYLARATSRFHSGYIHHYANIMLLSLMFFLL